MNTNSISTIPRTARPVVGRQFILLTLDATTAGAVRLLTSRVRLLDGHVGVTEANDFLLTILASLDHKLLAAFHLALRFVARHVLLASGLSLLLRHELLRS